MFNPREELAWGTTRLDSIRLLLASLAAPERVAVAATTEAEEERTNVWTSPEAAGIQREAAAGGAAHHPRATPGAALSVAVAPPASAPRLRTGSPTRAPLAHPDLSSPKSSCAWTR